MFLMPPREISASSEAFSDCLIYRYVERTRCIHASVKVRMRVLSSVEKGFASIGWRAQSQFTPKQTHQFQLECNAGNGWKGTKPPARGTRPRSPTAAYRSPRRAPAIRAQLGGLR